MYILLLPLEWSTFRRFARAFAVSTYGGVSYIFINVISMSYVDNGWAWAWGGFLVFRVVELHSTPEFKVATSVEATRTHTHVRATFFSLNFSQIVSAFRGELLSVKVSHSLQTPMFSSQNWPCEKAQRKVNSSQLVGDITHMTNSLDSIAVIGNDKCEKWGECSHNVRTHRKKDSIRK